MEVEETGFQSGLKVSIVSTHTQSKSNSSEPVRFREVEENFSRADKEY